MTTTPPPLHDPYSSGEPGAPFAAPTGSAAPPAPYVAGPGAPVMPGGWVPPQPPRTDGVSIAALVTGLLGMALVPLGLGIAGVVRTKDPARSGRGLAVTGIVLGALSTVAWSLVVLLVVFAASSDEFREGFEQGYESTQENAGLVLEPGDCVQLPADLTEQVRDVEHVDCTTPHTAEIVDDRELTGTEYPGQDEVIRTADEFCAAAVIDYLAPGSDTSDLDFGYLYPTSLSWSWGDRQIDCWVQSLDGSPLTSSLAGSAT